MESRPDNFKNRPGKVGIMGGTFDPIHYGHLILAEEVREQFALDRVIFIPTGNPPHKRSTDVTDAIHRYNMARLATRDNPFFDVSRIEIDRTGYTYTVDTLREIKDLWGEDTVLYFIIGGDIVPQLITWKDPMVLLELVDFVVAMRPGSDNGALFSEMDTLRRKYGARMSHVRITQMDISSTGIRNRVRRGHSIKYLLPEEVRDYICNNGLYRSDAENSHEE